MDTFTTTRWKTEKADTERMAYSLKETADLLGVSIGHLRNEERRGYLRFFKSGGRTLVLRKDLNKYLGITDGARNKGAEPKGDLRHEQ